MRFWVIGLAASVWGLSVTAPTYETGTSFPIRAAFFPGTGKLRIMGKVGGSSRQTGRQPCL